MILGYIIESRSVSITIQPPTSTPPHKNFVELIRSHSYSETVEIISDFGFVPNPTASVAQDMIVL